ncbi:MAG TPA: aldose 1-epimerase [Solirubrobacteraceae bacterium]|nr:aldose 1-epimerase [Solirubrobacteraceae bacterium]
MGGPAADGYDTVAIESPGSELRATFVPRAGMVCCSLRHRGVELLAQRSGVRAYAQRGATMGIPLLYPWANRLAGLRYPGPQGEVQLDPADPSLKLDQNGLPIHGAIAGALPWELLEQPGAEAGRSAGDHLDARLAWDSTELLAIFPYRHAVELRARVEGARLRIATTVRADGGCAVPVSFGFHPYLTIAGAGRAEWQVELPVAHRLLLDERMIPMATGPPIEPRRFTLADGSWDDALAGLDQPAAFTVSAGERRIDVQFGTGFSHAQIYAPSGEDFICFEPMTAPTNALISRDALPVVAAGETFQAEFSIAVSELGPAYDPTL